MTQNTTDRPQRPPSEEDGAPPGRPSSTTRKLGQGSLAGYLCADPDLKYVGMGKPLTKIRLAQNDRLFDPDTGTWHEGEEQYIDLSVWGKQAENAAESLRSGDRVVVTGIWQENGWLGRDGQWHTRKSLNVRDIGPSLMHKQVNVLGRKEKRT